MQYIYVNYYNFLLLFFQFCPLLASSSASIGELSTSRFLGNYMDDLRLRHCYGDGSDSFNSFEENDLYLLYPDRFRYRSRVGRGGRLVMDRVPVRFNTIYYLFIYLSCTF
jgi:hypothetical protein